MKKLIALFLALAMCVSMFAACGQEATPTAPATEATTEATQPQGGEVVDLSDPEGLAAALEYLKTIYKNAGGLTPKDFTRIGTVPVGTKRFEVVWTANVSEDLVKAVRGEDGMVTIDVNEECDTETPYTLTATLTDEAGNSVSYSWEHTLPAVLNVSDILDQAYALESGASLPYEVTLTGVVTSIDTLWSDQYGNITVTIAMEGHEDRPVQCYRLSGDGAKDIAVGDTITVTGTITNYKGLIEFAQGCTLDNRISGGGSAPTPVEYTRYQPFPNGQKVVIYNVKYGVALSSKKTSHYNVGVKKSSYGATEVWTAVLHSNGTYSFVNADGEALGMGSEYSSMDLGEKYDRWEVIKLGRGKFLIRNLKRDDYFMEWYAKYNNFSTYNYHAPETDDQYIMNFILLDDDEVPEVEKPDTTMVPELVTDPQAGTAYKLYVEQKNVEKTLYFTGKTANQSYYLATTEDYKEAVDVFVEEVEGGCRLYFMDGEKKVYIDAFVNGTYNNARLTEEPTAVFKYDSEYNTYVADLNGTACYIGAYSSYETLSVSKYSYIATSFPAHLGTLKETVVIKELTVAEAIAMGSAMDHNTYTEEKYYVTGEITEVYNEKYGNMRIKDAEGNILTIYGTYSADGSTRYDALEVKPVAGDTVKLLGIIGQYSGTAQMQNGWIVEHTPAAGGEEGGETEVTGVTITFDDKAKRTEFDTTKQVWVENGITVTNEKAGSTSNVGDYANPARFYKGSSLTVAYAGMTKIEFNCDDYKATYVTDLVSSLAADGYEATADGLVVTVAFETAIDSFTVSSMAGQVRMDSITVYAGEGGEEPEVPGDPAADTELTIPEALALGAGKEHDTYTEAKYYVTGEITEVYNEKYGNMRIKDAEGNILTVYGTYSADGNTRYDSLEVKPVAGDTVKVYGIIGQYNGTAQMKNGWIVEHTPAASGEEPEVPGEGGEAASDSATITFDSEAKMTSSSDTEQVWEENGIVFTYSKASSSNFAVYSNPIRCYAGTNIKIAYPGMTKIVFECAGGKILAADGAVTDGNIVTITLDAPVDSYSIDLTAQARFASITVYTDAGEEGGEEPEVPGEGGEVGETTTVTVSIADYASANGWTNGTLYDTVNMNEVVKVTVTGTPGSYGQNTGKYYTNGNNWRIYQNESPAITVSAEGKTIVSVKITYASEKTGILTLNGENVASDAVVTVNAASVTFSVGNTDTVTNGQVRITAIEVVYG